jgi:hypothetical protein
MASRDPYYIVPVLVETSSCLGCGVRTYRYCRTGTMYAYGTAVRVLKGVACTAVATAVLRTAVRYVLYARGSSSSPRQQQTSDQTSPAAGRAPLPLR